ncbi:hypothetical protein JN01_0626 [Entomoplasma freundtii]|uniref:Uncharacterized protein n=1 Tax=Entomoplasma freundtii TaxID=74700 RepID=A0A2K8NRC4_9MOLU|nr:hypothetical protein [Entomoplasma freundtii]ATZ16334.1 hypothetical protein EFREU_v1c03080 [Entomoplasma freundtii]TDY56627.1 hypothetical protein JN01_0626 [Entomoplasma freundtii]
MKNWKVTPKTYTWIKPLVTVSSICLLINPLFILLKVIRQDSFFVKTWSALLIVNLVLYAIAILAFLVYWSLRIKLIHQSHYKQTKKDRKLLWSSLSVYSLGFLAEGIYLLSGLLIKDKLPDAYVSFGILYAFIIGGVIAGAVLETVSRIPEQIFLLQEEEKEIRKLKLAKREEILHQQTTEKDIVDAVKKQRTPEAQTFLNREPKPQNEDDFNPFA